MSPSAPIDILHSSSSSSSSSSVTSSGLYIPIHKRSGSNSSRSASPILFDSESERIGVYTQSDLLLLAGSPLAYLPAETLSYLRENVPDIIRQRKTQRTHQSQPVPPRSTTRVIRRPAKRSGSDRRRGAATKVVDALNWRGTVAVLSQT